MNSSQPHRSSLGSSAVRFPLPPDFFPPVSCNDAQAAVLQEEADKIVRDTVRTERWEMHNEDSVRGWKLASSKKHFRDMGVRTYIRKPESNRSPVEKQSRRIDFKCMGMVSMPLDQAMDALYSDNTQDCRHNAGALLEGCLDAAVLHVIRQKTDLQPRRYLGINWLALRSPGMFAKKRDVCYLKSTGTTFVDNRDEVGYFVMRSIELDECPPMYRTFGLKRTTLSAILLLKEMPDGRSTSVIWQGTMPLSKSSSSKVLDFIHGNFMSTIGNLNVFTVTQYLTRDTEAEHFVATRDAKACHLCKKKFSLLRSRHQCHACGENMCRDCEVTRKTTSLDRETQSSFSEKDKVRRYCKQCMVAARRKAETVHVKPMVYDFTGDILNVTDSTATSPVGVERQSERMSAVSSTGSYSSIQLTWPDLLRPNRPSNITASYTTTPNNTSYSQSSRHSYAGSATTTPTFAATGQRYTADFSTNQVPVSPLTIKSKRSQPQLVRTGSSNVSGGRDRLETDPWEYYDDFTDPEPEVDGGKPSLGGRGSTYSNHDVGRESTYSNPERGSASYSTGRRSTFSNDGSVEDLAMRLWEMSRKAQETLDTTRRNSCMMSDAGSAPRSSEQFQQLDRSIAEQADLLNVIGFVSTGRVYMETGEDENGELSGVRMSETSDDEEDRFEILT